MQLKNIFSKINQNKSPKKKSPKQNKKGKCLEIVPCIAAAVAGFS